jgi:hypothetical protein
MRVYEKNSSSSNSNLETVVKLQQPHRELFLNEKGGAAAQNGKKKFI